MNSYLRITNYEKRAAELSSGVGGDAARGPATGGSRKRTRGDPRLRPGGGCGAPGPVAPPPERALKNETPAMDCQGLLGFVLCYFSSYHHGSSFASDAMAATKRYCFVMFYSLPGLSSRRT